jgi:hypothetical protein
VIAAALILLCSAAAADADQAAAGWLPPTPTPDKFDWIQLKSGEWLAGRLIAMYDESLEFDSEELDDQEFDWEDIRQVRTARIVRVAFLDDSVATGKLVIEGNRVLVTAEPPYESTRSQVLSITSGAARKIHLWSGDLSAGLNYRTGNTSQTEANASAILTRRTPRDRFRLEYLGNFTSTDGTTTADNQRATTGWNRFVSDRFYLTPAYVEYYRDPFQNIAARWTAGAGVGYQLIDTKKIDWNVNAGLAYQRTGFSEVAEGDPSSDETPALVLSTRYDNELAKWVDLFFSYKVFVVDEESGTYTHNLWAGVEFEFVKNLEFDVSVVWDRIEDPRPDADGTTPLQDDFRTILAFGYSF